MNPDILRSMEVRWFFQEDLAKLDNWWKKALPKSEKEGSDEKGEDNRIDLYLMFPDAGFAGVKLREYKANTGKPAGLNLEFKLREQEYGTIRFQNNIAGVVERWRKWSTRVSQSAEDYIAAATGSSAGWLGVKKIRQLQKFSYENFKLNCVKVSDRPDEGCNVELSDLFPHGPRVRKEIAWKSLCFEAFSSHPGADLTAILWRTTNHVFSIVEAPALTAVDSCGYPEWLNQISSATAEY